jgi:hypothetical protein
MDTGAIEATITIPAGTTVNTHLRSTSFSLSGSHIYKLRLGGNTSTYVRVARIIIQQEGASKTRIQIPLVKSSTDYTFVPYSYGTNYDSLWRTNFYNTWRKIDSAWSTVSKCEFELLHQNAHQNLQYDTNTSQTALFNMNTEDEVDEIIDSFKALE